MKYVINDGLLGGCLERFSGSGLSQYSSSQSTGKSKSRLMNYVKKDSRGQRRFVQLVLGARSTQGGTEHFFHAYEHPVHFGDLKSQQWISLTYQNARFHNSSLGVCVRSWIFRLWAPTSCAKRIPIPPGSSMTERRRNLGDIGCIAIKMVFNSATS